MGTRSQIAFLIALTLAIYLGSAFSPALLDGADSVHAEVAREILERDDWVTPHVNGIRYLEKAPLLYWAIAASFRLLGVWELPARLPLVLGVLAFVLTLYGFGRYLFGPRAGFYAGLGGATSFGVYLFTRILIPEILLALFITAACFCFLATQIAPASRRAPVQPPSGLLGARGPEGEGQHGLPQHNPSPWLYDGMYAAMALAVLTKGLIGIILPAGTIGLYLLVTGRLRLAVLRKMHPGTGVLLFLVIAAPWHILAGLLNEKFFWFYFINEHFLSYLRMRVPSDYDTVPLLAFWGLHLVWLLPWTPFVVLASQEVRQCLRPRSDRERVLLFLWLWAGLVVVFFSFSTRQEYSTLPAYPAFILLAAHTVAEREVFRGQVLVRVHRALVAVGVLVAAGLGALLMLSRGIHAEGDIANLLTKNLQPYVLWLGEMFDLTPHSFALLRAPAWGAAATLLIGTLLALRFRSVKRHLAANLALALMAAAFFYWAHAALNVFSPYLSSKKLAQTIAAAVAPGDRIVINGEYESGSTLNFYTGHQVYILNGRSAKLWFGSSYSDAPRIFLKDNDLAQLWQERGRVFLFTKRAQKTRLEQRVGPARVFAGSGGKLVLVNR